MKKIVFLLLIIGFASSCKCKQNIADNKKAMENNCPENTLCSTEVLENSTMVIIQDVTNKPFCTIAEQEGTTVYRYKMSEGVDSNYEDSGYREELIFELPSDFKDGTISGKDILKTNALLGVFCFCKEKAGYYKINEGSITKSGNTFSIEIPVLVDGQKTTKLEVKF